MTDVPVSFRCSRGELIQAAERLLGVRNLYLSHDLDCPEAPRVVKHLMLKFELDGIDPELVNCHQAEHAEIGDCLGVQISVEVRPNRAGQPQRLFLESLAKLQDLILPRGV